MNDGDPASSVALFHSLVLVVGLLLCLLLSGSISALVTLSRMQSDGLIQGEGEGVPGRSLLRRVRGVLLTVSVVFLASASIAAASIPPLLETLRPSRPLLAAVLAWALYFLLLVLGSAATKALALARPVGYVQAVIALLWPLYALLRPAIWLLEGVVAKLLPSVWALDLSPPLSGREIRGLLAEEETSGLVEEEELAWARSIFELSDTEIREIMVPRIDMVGLDVSTALGDAIRLAAKARFTRLPVWEENQDKILGLLHTKDLLSAHARGETPSVREILRPVHFLPESKPIDEALQEFRRGRIHLAVVVDEYGGTAGIVTLEDILEEIVGEIRDEYDQEGELVRIADPHRAVIDPRIDLDDLNQLLNLELPTDENDTLGGLLYALCGRVPIRGDEVEYEGLHFTIDRVERQRIRQVTLQSPTALQVASGPDQPSPESPS